MLNEAPNSNDVKRVANNVFNEAPNSNDATRVGAFNCCGRTTILNGDYSYSHHAEKPTYQRREIMTR